MLWKLFHLISQITMQEMTAQKSQLTAFIPDFLHAVESLKMNVLSDLTLTY